MVGCDAADARSGSPVLIPQPKDKQKKKRAVTS